MRPATCFNAASMLRLPLHQRMVVQQGQGDDGQPVLQLFYGDQEVSFDEPALFCFGQTLARQARFAAGDAMHWTSDGSTLPWTQVQPLLAPAGGSRRAAGRRRQRRHHDRHPAA